MKTTVRSIPIVFLLISPFCLRADDSSFYVTADGGAILQQRSTLYQPGTPPAGTTTYNPGARCDLEAGYNITPWLATELEGGFMWNTIDKIYGNTLSAINQSVDIYSFPVLANVIFKVPTQCALDPYFGIGGGVNVSTFDFKDGIGTYTDTDVEPAMQAQLGVKCRITQNASIGIDYEFLATLDQHYYLSGISDPITISHIFIHGLFLKLTWAF